MNIVAHPPRTYTQAPPLDVRMLEAQMARARALTEPAALIDLLRDAVALIHGTSQATDARYDRLERALADLTGESILMVRRRATEPPWRLPPATHVQRLIGGWS